MVLENDGRRLIGHDGSVPGITTIMMANEKRNLGIIILTNGDTVRDDSQAEQVQTTINYMTKELFDCFEKSTNKGSTYRSFNFLIYGIITIFNLLIML
jgi:hypothetical protein